MEGSAVHQGKIYEYIHTLIMRKSNITLLRTIVTLLVVLFHSLGCYTNGWNFPIPTINIYDYFCSFINKINMPIFVTISGYLYALGLNNGKYVDNISLCKNKFLHLMVPYLIWSLIQIIVFPELEFFSILTGCLHLWFLLMLFVLFILFSSIKGYLKNMKCYSSILLLIILLLLPVFVNFPRILALNSVMSYALYFYAGFLLVNVNWRNKIVGKEFLILIFGVLLLIAVGVSGLNNVWYGKILVRFSCFMTVFSIITISEKWVLNVNEFVGILDKNSMGIYILHHIFIWWFVQQKFTQNFIIDHYLIAPIIMFSSSLLLSFIISMIINKSKFKIILG